MAHVALSRACKEMRNVEGEEMKETIFKMSPEKIK
jgi:hypothetical protein